MNGKASFINACRSSAAVGSNVGGDDSARAMRLYFSNSNRMTMMEDGNGSGSNSNSGGSQRPDPGGGGGGSGSNVLSGTKVVRRQPAG